MVICDVRVPDKLKNDFSEMPPMLKKFKISNQDVEPYMADLCKLDEFKTPRLTHKQLYWKADNAGYTTSLVLLQARTGFIRYGPICCFEDFMDEVVAARREAGCCTSGMRAGNTAKLIGKLVFLTLLIKIIFVVAYTCFYIFQETLSMAK